MLCTVLGLVLAFVSSSFLINKKYSSTLKLTYEETINTEVTDTIKVRRIATCVETITENVYLENLRVYLNDNNYSNDNSIYPELLLSKQYTVIELSKMIEASYDKSTLSMSIAVISLNYRDAKIIADAIESDEMKQALCVVARIDEGVGSAYTNLKTYSSPKENIYPVSPNIALYSVAGFLLGFIIGVLLGLLLEKLDVRIKDEEDLLSKYDLPVLGIIPNFPEIEEKN